MKKIWRFARRVFNFIQGKDFFEKIDCSVMKEKFGSSSCGWTIAPEQINEKSIIYSVGVGEEISFDLAIIERFGLSVYAFDPTPRSIEWIKSQNLPVKFKLEEFGLSDFDGLATFYPPENPNYISHSVIKKKQTKSAGIKVKMKKLETIMEELGHSNIDILKIDIEGAEYSVIEDLKRSKIRPKQILIEFHHRFREIGINKSKEAISTLRRMGYQLFSISDNGEEYSFILNESNLNLN